MRHFWLTIQECGKVDTPMVGSRLKPQNEKKNMPIIDEAEGKVPRKDGKTYVEETVTQNCGKTALEETVTHSDEETDAAWHGDLNVDGRDSEM